MAGQRAAEEGRVQPDEGEAIDRGAIRRLHELKTSADDPIVVEILDLFLEDAPERMSEISRAFEAADGEGMGRAAHALKSSCGSIGALRMHALLSEIESMGRRAEIGGAGAKITELTAEFHRAKRALEQERVAALSTSS